ncbi:glycosyltransferase family 61 protein [Prosthecobacter sp.]|uniref:glycosyltransferase family 61 protein n=1 Tax=Prosthecobacter sp. TaxID=1965333 RepID=UPI002AB8334C|nr:glycosyltransferase family 61 protein [Prosthecobacter sp.]MDZ4405807.1 glycosyltransferase family 61 protein [Prosthecobacter sp.]
MSQLLTRKIHDWYAGLASSVSKLRRTEKPPVDALIEQWQIQTAGEHVFDNRFEAEVLGTAENTTRYWWPDASAYRLRNVRLAGGAGQVYFQNGEIFNVDPLTRREKKDRVLRRPVPGMRHEVKGPLLHLCGPNSENHGHFILDYLPKLMPFLERFRAEPRARILLSPGRKKWQCRYLARFGIPEDRVIEAGYGTLAADELWYVPILHAEDGVAKLSAPRNHFAARDALAAEPDSKDAPLCIFASRLDAPNKKLLNEERLAERAREILGDVRTIKLSEHSLAEQLRLFASATVIIGAVGQNLTEVLCATGKLVLVMTVEEKILPGRRSWGRAYHNLALLGGNKAVLLTRDTPWDADRNWSFNEDRFADVLARAWKLFQQDRAFAGR